MCSRNRKEARRSKGSQRGGCRERRSVWSDVSDTPRVCLYAQEARLVLSQGTPRAGPGVWRGQNRKPK